MKNVKNVLHELLQKIEEFVDLSKRKNKCMKRVIEIDSIEFVTLQGINTTIVRFNRQSIMDATSDEIYSIELNIESYNNYFNTNRLDSKLENYHFLKGYLPYFSLKKLSKIFIFSPFPKKNERVTWFEL